MPEPKPLAEFAFSEGGVPAALEFLKRTRSELRTLRRVRVFSDRFQVYDVNGDFFEISGVGYPSPDVIPLLEAVNTNFKPETIHAPTSEPFKEYLTGRRYCWAQDRVM